MPNYDNTGRLTDELDENRTPPEVRDDLGTLDPEDRMTPQTFGTFGHQAYEWAAEEDFDDVESNRSVIVTQPDGTETQGYIDTLIDERVIVDYKTNDMRNWSEADARWHGNNHGRQVAGYVNSREMPDDAQGWLIATVPPESADVRQAYTDAAGAHGVGVKFSKGEQQTDVMEAVSEAIAESEPAASVDTDTDTDTDTDGQ